MGAEDRKLPAQELHQVDRERIVKLFEQLDINNDNTIDVQEIRNKLKEQGISLDHAEIIIEKCDKNKDGRIDVTEFVDYCIEKEKELWDVFHYVDTNKDGTIDGEEIKTRLNELGIKVTDQNIRLLLEKMDKDGDVKINWEEWRDFLLLQPSTNWEDISKVWHHATFGDYPEITEEFTPNGLWWRQLLAGGAAGTVSRTCTAPLDRLKVFFQVQSMYSEGGRHPFTLKSCLRHMLNEGGVRSLWRGNGINVIKIAPETALRFFAYEKAKGFLKGDKSSNLKAHEKLLAGSTAGVIAQTTIYPMEVLKTRLALGRTGQYSGMSDCFRQIIRNEGWVGFYRGLTPSLLGIIPYAGIDLAVYETLKNLWLKSHDSSDPGILIPLACGTVSSTAGQLVSYPLSLLRTRLQAQTSPVRGEDKGLGMIDIFSTIIKEEGVSGLYRGLLPNFLKVIPAVSIGYVVYEQFKKILKVTSVK